MDTRTICIVVSVLTLILVVKYLTRGNYVKADSGVSYNVRKQPDEKYAANTLDILRNLSIEISDKMGNIRLERKIDTVKFEELYTGDDNIIGVSVNKGDTLKLRLYNKNGSKIPFGEIYLTLLHELAHIIAVKYGHHQSWENRFEYLKSTFPLGSMAI